jgi:hypothetical protein
LLLLRDTRLVVVVVVFFFFFFFFFFVVVLFLVCLLYLAGLLSSFYFLPLPPSLNDSPLLLLIHYNDATLYNALRARKQTERAARHGKKVKSISLRGK